MLQTREPTMQLRVCAYQNLTRIVNCRLRICFTDCGKPNCVLCTFAFQLLNTGWFSRLLASMRASRKKCLFGLKVRCIAPSRLQVFGPVMELRPALHQAPAP